MQQHEFRMHPGPFQSVKTGKKTIESRLLDEKRQKIKLGDRLVFVSRANSQDSVTAEVAGLLHFATFRELFESRPVAQFNKASVEDLLNEVYQYYTTDDEERLGVVGIEFKIRG